MECCGNTIKDLYGFSCPLKCSTYILQSASDKNKTYTSNNFELRLHFLRLLYVASTILFDRQSLIYSHPSLCHIDYGKSDDQSTHMTQKSTQQILSAFLIPLQTSL